MASTPKVHLPSRHGVAVCGSGGATRLSSDPARVTCKACRKSVLMADAEVRQSNEGKRAHTVKEGRP